MLWPRKYSRTQEHEKEILELRQKMTLRQIGENLESAHKEMQGFSRYNRKQKRLAAGIPPKPKEQQGKMKSESQALQNTNIRLSG